MNSPPHFLFEARLRELFGLSPREARLALAFVRHCDIAVAAGALHISHNTAKTHLKNIFAKTGCNKQTQLMKLLCTVGTGQDRESNSPV